MHKFLSFISKIKWIGLIGALGQILGNSYLKLFWLFMLLGLIEILFKIIFSIPTKSKQGDIRRLLYFKK
jgi:hypothetical protein